MTTSRRYKALQWFADHEEVGGYTKNLFRTAPSTKMRRLMAKEEQLYRKPLGHFGYQGWLLTPKGRELLVNKKQRENAP